MNGLMKKENEEVRDETTNKESDKPKNTVKKPR